MSPKAMATTQGEVLPIVAPAAAAGGGAAPGCSSYLASQVTAPAPVDPGRRRRYFWQVAHTATSNVGLVPALEG